MDQVIKQYKESTGKDARVMFIVVGEDGGSKEYKFFTDEFVIWLMEQLTWRSIENPPEEDGWIFIQCWVNDNKLETWIDSVPFFRGSSPEEVWNNFVAEHNIESWIPIPKILESQR